MERFRAGLKDWISTFSEAAIWADQNGPIKGGDSASPL